MRYYKVTLTNGDVLYHEAKGALSDGKVLRELAEKNELDSADAPGAEVEEITEEEYEENCY